MQVVLVRGEPSQPVQLLSAEQVIAAGLGQPGEMLCVRLAQLLSLPGFGQPLLTVDPDDLQHPVACPVRSVPHGEQRLVRERGYQVKHLIRADAAARAYLHGRLQHRTAAEDGEAAPEHSLGVVEQVPAPVDDRAERLMPRHRGAASAGQQPEPVIEAGRDLLRGHGAQPGRGELDRERHAVESTADPGYGGRVDFGDLELGEDGAGSLDQQADRGEVFDAGRVLTLAGWRHPETFGLVR